MKTLSRAIGISSSDSSSDSSSGGCASNSDEPDCKIEDLLKLKLPNHKPVFHMWVGSYVNLCQQIFLYHHSSA